MLELLNFSKTFIKEHITESSVVADFTMGNGHDTEWLCSLVPNGHVYAFDVQKQAVDNTRDRLEKGGYSNFELFLDSHANCEKYIECEIDAGMFNLGYLPRSGRKTVTTMRETTLPAVIAALELLDPDGVLIVAIYPGHEEGALEGEMLREYFSGLSKYRICPSEFHILNSPDSPYFFLIEKSRKAKFGEI